MPELPEVEATRRSLVPHLVGRKVVGVAVREPRLRRLIDRDLLQRAVMGHKITSLRRRSKYLLIDLGHAPEGGVMAVHLGMTGWLGVVARRTPLKKHDHVDFELDDGRTLRFNDARRFGSIDTFLAADEASHALFAHLGCEPFDTEAFVTERLWQATRGAARSIKTFLLEGKFVVGVGNIYCSEALWRAQIDPRMAAGRLSRPRAAALVASVRETLFDALKYGGTTLRDFTDGDGQAGGYGRRLRIYGRAGNPCYRCDGQVVRVVQQQRSTFLCRGCQKR